MLGRLLALLLAGASACGDEGSPADLGHDLRPGRDLIVHTDLSPHPDRPDGEDQSTCGDPGDPGNALGVGAYCEKIADCDGLPEAKICAYLDHSTWHFCTLACDSDGGAVSCGAGAVCVRGERLGELCVPEACLPRDGGVRG